MYDAIEIQSVIIATVCIVFQQICNYQKQNIQRTQHKNKNASAHTIAIQTVQSNESKCKQKMGWELHTRWDKKKMMMKMVNFSISHSHGAVSGKFDRITAQIKFNLNLSNWVAGIPSTDAHAPISRTNHEHIPHIYHPTFHHSDDDDDEEIEEEKKTHTRAARVKIQLKCIFRMITTDAIWMMTILSFIDVESGFRMKYVDDLLRGKLIKTN